MLELEMSRVASWPQTNPAFSGGLLVLGGARTCSWIVCERIVLRGNQCSKHTLTRGMQASSDDKVSAFVQGQDRQQVASPSFTGTSQLVVSCHQARLAVGGFELGLVTSLGCFLNQRTYMYFKCLLQTYLLRKQVIFFLYIYNS